MAQGTLRACLAGGGGWAPGCSPEGKEAFFAAGCQFCFLTVTRFISAVVVLQTSLRSVEKQGVTASGETKAWSLFCSG